MASEAFSKIETLFFRLESNIPVAADRALRRIATRVQGLMKRNMHATPGPDDGRNATDKLYIRTGALIESWAVGGLNNSTTVERVGSLVTLRIGSQVAYARIHEYGGTAGHATIPARPYLHPSLDEIETLLRVDVARDVLADIRSDWQ